MKEKRLGKLVSKGYKTVKRTGTNVVPEQKKNKLAANVSWCFTPLCLEQGTAVTCHLALKAPITTAADDTFCDIFPNFRKKCMTFHENCLSADDSHEIVFLICYFWKSGKIWNCRLLQIIGGALSSHHHINTRILLEAMLSTKSKVNSH